MAKLSRLSTRDAMPFWPGPGFEERTHRRWDPEDSGSVQGGADRKGHPRKTSSLPLRRSIHGSEVKNRRVVNGGACLPVEGADTHRFRCRCLGTSGVLIPYMYAARLFWWMNEWRVVCRRGTEEKGIAEARPGHAPSGPRARFSQNAQGSERRNKSAWNRPISSEVSRSARRRRPRNHRGPLLGDSATWPPYSAPLLGAQQAAPSATRDTRLALLRAGSLLGRKITEDETGSPGLLGDLAEDVPSGM
ncbi:hypothetical protein MTP99_012447 [Tenebrio molitor]|nr:hypothetical protein MTP99_012447 [Tenebrio molitor]